MTTCRCEHCGATEDVVSVMAYVGGRGHQERQRCSNLFRCWARWGEQQDTKSRPAAGPRRAA